MKKDLIIFLSAVSLYILNRLTMGYYANDMVYWFMSCYFNDIVGSVAFVAYCNFLLATQNRRLQRLSHIILLMFSCGLVWEYIAPLFRKDTVTDLLDFGAYILGGFIYWLIDRKRNIRPKQR